MYAVKLLIGEGQGVKGRQDRVEMGGTRTGQGRGRTGWVQELVGLKGRL